LFIKLGQEKQSTVNPGQGPGFLERQGGNDRAVAQTPAFSRLAATTPSRLPWTEGE